MSLLVFSAPALEHQSPGVEIEKVLFSSVILKTEFVATKLVTAINHLRPSHRFIGGENEKCFLLVV